MDEKELEKELTEFPESEELDLEQLLKDIEINEESAGNEPAEQERQPEKKPRRKKKEEAETLQESILYLHDLVYLLAAVIVVFLLCFRVVVVSGTSMNQTLLDGDYLLLLGDVFYREPKAGDIIVASKQSFDDAFFVIVQINRVKTVTD